VTVLTGLLASFSVTVTEPPFRVVPASASLIVLNTRTGVIFSVCVALVHALVPFVPHCELAPVMVRFPTEVSLKVKVAVVVSAEMRTLVICVWPAESKNFPVLVPVAERFTVSPLAEVGVIGLPY
jgi:hypothetical protein